MEKDETIEKEKNNNNNHNNINKNLFKWRGSTRETQLKIQFFYCFPIVITHTCASERVRIYTTVGIFHDKITL